MNPPKIVPPPFARALIFFMCSGMLLLGLTKIAFFIANWNTFRGVTFWDVLVSFWVDSMTVSLTFIPFALLWLLPFPDRNHRLYKGFMRVIYLASMIFLTAANLMDVVYFRFTGKRTTFDLFSVLASEEESSDQWLSYFFDFWWLLILLAFGIYLANKAFNFIYKKVIPPIPQKTKPIPYAFTVVLTIFAMVIIARGGFGLRPVGPIGVAKYANPDQVGFVTNTAFTLLKSLDDKGLERLDLLPDTKADKLFSPIRRFESKAIPDLQDSLNVVVFILESFGNEWLGSSRENPSFTPFFDSLCTEGAFFPNSYANGTKSIEAMPAVLASVPSLMEKPYISSQYASNRITSVGEMLEHKGYSSAFFHGATKGSMNFDGFASLIGFQKYYGKSDYPNPEDFDGTWGIYDHKFLPWCAQIMDKQKKPFFNSIFTISSHHPYTIPEDMKGLIKEGPERQCGALYLADYALRLFFEEVKKYEWFENTLFVFVSDHTSSSNSLFYGQRAGKYSIPILYYMPNRQIPIVKRMEETQQIDILPSVLHLLGYEKPFYAFGQSVFSEDYFPFGINYQDGIYNFFVDEHLMMFSNQVDFQLFDLEKDANLKQNIFDEKRAEFHTKSLFLQAFLQRYNNDLLDNLNHAPEKK